MAINRGNTQMDVRVGNEKTKASRKIYIFGSSTYQRRTVSERCLTENWEGLQKLNKAWKTYM